MTPDKLKEDLKYYSSSMYRCSPYLCEYAKRNNDLKIQALEYISELESDLQLLKNDYDNLKNVAAETVERNQRLRNKLMKTLNDLKTAKNKAIKEFTDKFLRTVYDNHYPLISHGNSVGYGMFTIGIEQAINKTIKEMVGEINDA